MNQKPKYDKRKDRELWVVSGSGWSIPLLCIHATLGGVECFHVTSAVHIGFAQSEVLDARLRSNGAHLLTHGWLIDQVSFASIASKAPGITPEFYFSWNGEQITEDTKRRILGEEPEVKERRKHWREDRRFINHVASATGLPFEQLAISWLAFVQHMPAWLMNGKPIDFGSFRLQGVPYRRNWKQLLFARFPNFRKILLVSDARKLMALVFTAASRMIRLAELTGHKVRKGRSIFDWTIEVQHDSSWDSMVEQIEGDAAQRAGPVAYVKRWANKVAEIEDEIYAILAEAVRKEMAPTCRIQWDRGQSGVRFVQAAPTVLCDPSVEDCDAGSGQGVDDFLGIGGSAQYLEGQAARLFQMSVQEPAVDVRVSRGADGGGSDTGMLVPPTDGCEAAGEGMLAGGARPEGELDR